MFRHLTGQGLKVLKSPYGIFVWKNRFDMFQGRIFSLFRLMDRKVGRLRFIKYNSMKRESVPCARDGAHILLSFSSPFKRQSMEYLYAVNQR